MRIAVCVILGVLSGIGCGRDPAGIASAAGSAGTADLVRSVAGPGAGAPAAVSGGAGSPAIAGRPAAAGSDGTAPVGQSGGSSGADTGARVAGAGGPGTGASGTPAAVGDGPAGTGSMTTERFSFFVTSLGGMRTLSKSDQGFGGDLRYGESTGLGGADKICTELAERSLPGAGAKGWRAFLSTAKGGTGNGPVHARDRVGQGPWYDRNGRLVAMTLEDLLQQRPRGADPAIVNDLPNENGIPNHLDTVAGEDDNHDVVTGSNAMGMYDGTSTCNDWTSIETPGATGAAGSPGIGMGGRSMMPQHFGPRIGHSWPAQSGMHWVAAHKAPGCSPSVALVQTGAGSGTGIGNGGGYGGIYCFALKP